MGNSAPNRNRRHGLALVATGFGIGRLTGLSVSPAVFVVLTRLTAATTIAALSGVKAALLTGERAPTMHKQLLNSAVKPLRELTIIMTNTHTLATRVEEVLCAVV